MAVYNCASAGTAACLNCPNNGFGNRVGIINPAPQPQTGWICPKCGAVWAPFVITCICVSKPDKEDVTILCECGHERGNHFVGRGSVDGKEICQVKGCQCEGFFAQKGKGKKK